MKIFQYQGWHFLLLSILLTAIWFIIKANPEIVSGNYQNVSTSQWLVLGLMVPVLHQVYVWFVWRLELHYNYFTRRLGNPAFLYYTVIFTTLFVGRLIVFLVVAESNRNSLDINPFLANLTGWLLAIPAFYTGYSVFRYFGFQRACGLDHFDPEIAQKPLVKKGIFKYTDNGMYLFAFFIFWALAFAYRSKAALLLAGFNHIYIWVHYYCTEKPDMYIIYKNT